MRCSLEVAVVGSAVCKGCLPRGSGVSQAPNGGGNLNACIGSSLNKEK